MRKVYQVYLKLTDSETMLGTIVGCSLFLAVVLEYSYLGGLFD